ncbi:hypothetical protein NDA01_30810 [Trichocoleus desertorum AS-A10]|uniref:hypothetical protein n=1 Tax=Trichocoleus desertorum TaxID=1481672 RepID=UPI0032984DE3
MTKHPIMVNPSTSESDSSTILSNLIEVDATLAAQEAALITQLEAVREKRHSLKTVIDLFSTASLTSTSTSPVADTAISAPITPDSATPTTSGMPAESPLEKPKVEKRQQPRNAEKPATLSKGNSAPKAARGSKTAKSSKNWQDYLQPAFQKTSLPAAIAAVFQQQPQELLSVADLMAAIFVDRLPPDLHNPTHRRILNILSTGAKEGQWYRGQRGQYSLSQV